MNLNNSIIESDGEDGFCLKDYSCNSNEITVVFRNLEEELIRNIRESDYIIGCVAWLTNKKILSEISEKKGVLIIVQKEDFLRPDSDSPLGWKNILRQRYDGITGICRPNFGGLLTEMSYCSSEYINPIRCVGNHNSNKNAVTPRMHNKFIVFCKKEDRQLSKRGKTVWTGSFNFTENGTNSFENAVIIKNQAIAQAYFNEFCQIAALSEPLDWESPWMAPEWRMGS